MIIHSPCGIVQFDWCWEQDRYTERQSTFKELAFPMENWRTQRFHCSCQGKEHQIRALQIEPFQRSFVKWSIPEPETMLYTYLDVTVINCPVPCVIRFCHIKFNESFAHLSTLSTCQIALLVPPFLCYLSKRRKGQRCDFFSKIHDGVELHSVRSSQNAITALFSYERNMSCLKQVIWILWFQYSSALLPIDQIMIPDLLWQKTTPQETKSVAFDAVRAPGGQLMQLHLPCLVIREKRLFCLRPIIHTRDRYEWSFCQNSFRHKYGSIRWRERETIFWCILPILNIIRFVTEFQAATLPFVWASARFGLICPSEQGDIKLIASCQFIIRWLQDIKFPGPIDIRWNEMKHVIWSNLNYLGNAIVDETLFIHFSKTASATQLCPMSSRAHRLIDMHFVERMAFS
jgi:hypothetical protein